ncbi:hypothetical protein BATDEDRAFT_34007 [Batrachochytrium dendrobatidis JAM81]|uniref:Uncharacterized protein n=2 Tax=Batrachochytrium dendrobatidis TaxID=109871 RepID=F4NTS9_BATDJ|nr:uncharacterized protein BATDEDRAFT_34007 [Batrachochytrium dendrobatidis JAM81]EGF83131.1 hypothetical protein BATDEDRAFT_34007 [Batrachochytrium dendrobatidis JAM81]KAK5671731.1 hypothetical protein QVD99_001567 [Batrachochytrium dendrobatidis]OAJ36268.1 hypothetical protein BDEG_20460 [Batrachochytrium dendrobatidis JEL423]|eukprot:XP_006675720.1 hypothetical protein BATDEDRAFT_34007 [Batrachochytrium dendrobatidis JAM81]
MDSLRNSVLGQAHKKEIRVSASSVIDLKAELIFKQEQYDRDKKRLGVHSSTNSISTANLTRLKNIPKIVKNKGVADRAQKDDAQISEEHPTLEASWVALQRKTKLYEQKQQDLEPNDEEGLVDFLVKNIPENDDIRVDNQDVSDPKWVQVTDEFGRTRIVRKKEADLMGLGRFVKASSSQNESSKSNHASGDNLDEHERQEWENASNTNIVNKHYDTTLERRTMGVGFYHLSQDETARQKQLLDLKNIRSQTETTRHTSQALKEKRKSRTDDRRALLLARAEKRKRGTGNLEAFQESKDGSNTTDVQSGRADLSNTDEYGAEDVDSFLCSVISS